MAAKGEKNGHHFLKLSQQECNRLLSMANRVDDDVKTPNLSEETKGKLRVASGKSMLLVTKKMEQFKQLCFKNIDQSQGDAPPTTNNDLEAFWEIIMLQVNELDGLFAEINILRENNWKKETGKGIDVQFQGASKYRKPRKEQQNSKSRQ